ncbi:FAD binding domain-containing protein, partial [Streptomyces sp. NPDC004561]
MREFDYRRASDVAGAVALLGADPDTRFLGGGTNLVDLMKAGVERPARLIDIRELPLDEIEPTPEGGLRIGATVTNGDLAAHPEVQLGGLGERGVGLGDPALGEQGAGHRAVHPGDQRGV